MPLPMPFSLLLLFSAPPDPLSLNIVPVVGRIADGKYGMCEIEI
jgi:hypothetical protein